ncbi:circularly permuted type 2 ATP-grasp protein [Kribbella qitaiheensis]|uniref:Circularly permuted type 2 ATP-grasp protein n=1 Tax=Kribbella qitaiheensis TaxID=1544730 RepID=A0A7G6WXD1_9ACTN|nr:glutathionylspermidine synthase family protein [Kribbella qitaiheensis]QNE18646.1 circularly permuted type 2 ATP-grasp protein [Kribbella qitaiheensis]
MTLTDDYLAAAADRGPKPGEIHAAVTDAVSASSYSGRSLSRPVFLEREAFDELNADLEVLYAAITGLKDRLYDGDLTAFARAIGLSDLQARVVARGSTAAPSRLCRADLYRDADGFHLLELNTGSTAGGVDNQMLNRAMLELPFVKEFVAEHDLVYLDTMDELVQTIIAEGKLSEGKPFVVIADFPDSYPELEEQLHKGAAELAKYGVDATACSVDSLELRDDDHLYLDGRRVDTIYRLFMLEDLLKPGAVELFEPVLRAAELGNVSIFTTLDAELYGSKGALALVSDEANRHLYSEEELVRLDRILPWTRLVRPGTVTVDGEQRELTEYALAHREQLVLKPTTLHGGQGVVLGWQTDEESWKSRLAAAMDSPHILQRRIDPVPELFPTDDGVEPWVLVWGAFLVARGAGGLWIRGSRGVDGTVVNLGNGALGTCCFHER